MSEHEMTVELTVQVEGDDAECAYPEVEITFSFTPGERERGPSYASGGEPATGPEIEFVRARVIDPSALALTPDEFDKLAIAYLDSDAGRERAIEVAMEC